MYSCLVCFDSNFLHCDSSVYDIFSTAIRNEVISVFNRIGAPNVYIVEGIINSFFTIAERVASQLL